MLVLSRRKDETIVIRTPSGDVIEVTLLGKHGQNRTMTKLGFTADKEIMIHRKELLERAE